MKEKSRVLVTAMILLAMWHTQLWAGQVVTEQVKVWAKRALSEEHSLQAITATDTVAVLYFHNLTQQQDLDPLQKGIAIMLMTDLSKVKGLNVVERVRIQALAEEMKLGVSGLVEKGTAPRLGKLLRAYWLLGGDLHRGDPTGLDILCNVLEVPPEKVAGQAGSKGVLEDLFKMEKEILFEVIRLLKVAPTREEDAELRKPLSTSIRALLLFFRGIDQSDRGNYAEAAKYYGMALKEDPGLALATDALKELQDLGLVGKTSKSKELLRSLRDRTSLTNQLTPHESVKRALNPTDVTTIELGQPPPPEPPPPSQPSRRAP
jgi:TolB-like protein